MSDDYSTPSTTPEPCGGDYPTSTPKPQTTSEPCGGPQTTPEPCGGWATPDQTPLHEGNRKPDPSTPSPTPCG